MDKDAEAYEPLSRAYGLPKSAPEEIAEKEEIMEARNRIADKSKHVREKLSKNRSQPSEPGTEQTECRPGAESIQP